MSHPGTRIGGPARATVGVLVLNFGEPETPGHDEVVDFLARIFRANSALDRPPGAADADARSRELAELRAPGLMEEYREIGGSPLHRQARGQAESLAAELGRRGRDAAVYSAMQYTEPSIPAAVAAMRADGVQTIVALPVYPLCGPSTTVAALRDLAAAIEEAGWRPDVREVTGWHRHPAYLRLRTEAIRRFATSRDVDLRDERTRLVFSAHGTPTRYLESGSRYAIYVDEWCEEVAVRLGVDRYELGFQNHANRPIEWTGPAIEDVIARVERADRVVVDAVSFMHEQSETLSELDDELREEAEGRGLGFHRVPIPHDAPEFVAALADLVEAALGTHPDRLPPLRSCLCRPGATVCFNGTERGSPAAGSSPAGGR